MPSARGQISLEFLLVLVSLFSIFLLFFPLIDHAFNSGVYSLNVLKGKNFLEEFRHGVEKTVLFHSTISLTEKIDSGISWNLFQDGNELKLEISSEKLKKSKIISVFLIRPISQFSSIDLDGKFSAEIKSENNFINVQFN